MLKSKLLFLKRKLWVKFISSLCASFYFIYVVSSPFAYSYSSHLAPPSVLYSQENIFKEQPDRLSRDTSWIEQNAPELAGKLLVTLSMEGHIPEFEGYPAQDANTKGGLGIYFGDKLEGLADIGMNAIGCQPGYGKVIIAGKEITIDYEEHANQGIIQRVLVGDDAIKVHAWKEDPKLGRIYHDENPLIPVEVYCIDRGGTPDFLFVSEVFDYLYDSPDISGQAKQRLHRFTQEIVFGKAVKEFLKQEELIPYIIHLNEAHTVVAAAQVDTSEEIAEIFHNDESFDKTAYIYTVHTNIPAGLERFSPGRMGTDVNRMSYVIGLPEGKAEQYRSRFLLPDGTVDFCHCAAMIADVINGVSAEHAPLVAKLFREMYEEDFPVEVAGILNGSGRYWIHEELNSLKKEKKEPNEGQLWNIHEKAKNEACAEIKNLTGIELDPNKQTVWLVRRLVDYKSQYPMLRFIVHLMTADRDKEFTKDDVRALWERDIPEFKQLVRDGTVDNVLNKIFKQCGNRNAEGTLVVNGLGQQLVVGGPVYEKPWVDHFNRWMSIPELEGRFVYIPDKSGSNMKLLKMQAHGSDILLNCPRPLEEACGTSTQRSALNGGVVITINGAGDREWVTEYNEQTGEGSGFFIGSYIKTTKSGVTADNEQFYKEAPADIFIKSHAASNLYYEKPDRWKQLMLNAYRAAHANVTATIMEQRYAPLYQKALRKQRNSRIIYEMVLRDLHDKEQGISGLKNALEQLPFLADSAMKYIFLIGLMKHGGSPYAVTHPWELDDRAGTEEDFRKFIRKADGFGLKVLIDWFANQHVRKNSDIIKEHPERFLWTNATDGNFFREEKDAFVVRGKDIPLDELKKKIKAGEEIIKYIKQNGIPGFGIITLSNGKTITFSKANKDFRKKVSSQQEHEPFLIHGDWTPLFVVSATDLVRLATGYPRRWEDLAQPDLDHTDVIRDALAIGEYWLNKGIHGFRIDAALSSIYQRIEENWGYSPENHLMELFIQRMREINPDCFFLFEAYEFVDELLKMAHYTNCAVNDWEAPDRIKNAILHPEMTHELRKFLEIRSKMPHELRRLYICTGPEHDAMDFQNELAQLSYQDRFLLYFFYVILDEYVHIFNGEIQGKKHNYRHAYEKTELVPRIEDADDQKINAGQKLFNLRIEHPVLNTGNFEVLKVKSDGINQRHIAVARYNSEEILIGVINFSEEQTSETVYLEPVLRKVIPVSERKNVTIIKTNMKINRGNFTWISDEPAELSVRSLFRDGLSVKTGTKGCELIRLSIKRNETQPPAPRITIHPQTEALHSH